MSTCLAPTTKQKDRGRKPFFFGTRIKVELRVELRLTNQPSALTLNTCVWMGKESGLGSGRNDSRHMQPKDLAKGEVGLTVILWELAENSSRCSFTHINQVSTV